MATARPDPTEDERTSSASDTEQFWNENQNEWIKRHRTDPRKARCTACNVTIPLHVNAWEDVKQHAEGKKHKMRAKGALLESEIPPIVGHDVPENCSVEGSLPIVTSHVRTASRLSQTSACYAKRAADDADNLAENDKSMSAIKKNDLVDEIKYKAELTTTNATSATSAATRAIIKRGGYRRAMDNDSDDDEDDDDDDDAMDTSSSRMGLKRKTAGEDNLQGGKRFKDQDDVEP